MFSTDKVQCYFQVLKNQWLCHLLIYVLFKRLVKIDLVNMVGIYIIDVSLMSAERKENSNSWMWYALIVKVVCFSHQNLNVNSMYFV